MSAIGYKPVDQNGTSDGSRGLIGTGSNQAPALTMTSKSVLAGLVLILVFALGVALLLRLHTGTSVPPLFPVVSPTPDAPATIMISCEKGNISGLTLYPRYSEYCTESHCTVIEGSDVAPEPALFARCRPDEDFTYDVQSAKGDNLHSERRPEIGFVLTGTGQVRDAFISRSSGSKSLDLTVLRIVASRKYRATGCGSCRIFVAPPVNLKKDVQ